MKTLNDTHCRHLQSDSWHHNVLSLTHFNKPYLLPTFHSELHPKETKILKRNHYFDLPFSHKHLRTVHTNQSFLPFCLLWFLFSLQREGISIQKWHRDSLFFIFKITERLTYLNLTVKRYSTPSLMTMGLRAAMDAEWWIVIILNTHLVLNNQELLDHGLQLPWTMKWSEYLDLFYHPGLKSKCKEN